TIQAEMKALGFAAPKPPSPQASREDVLRDLWIGAGVTNVQTRQIVVERTFADFDDYWTSILGGPSLRAGLEDDGPEQGARIKTRMRELLPVDAAVRITYGATANAVKGHR